jgi:hypothetical protein
MEFVNGFDRKPDIMQQYFVKINGRKEILHLTEFDRKLELSDTFFWLDDSDSKKAIKEKLLSVSSIDDFAKLDRETVDAFLVFGFKKIEDAEPTNTPVKKAYDDAFYLEIISELRRQIATLKKEQPAPIPAPDTPDPRMKKIQAILNNPFLEIK